METLSLMGWGGWRYNPALYTLTSLNGYEVDLEQFTTPAEALDWICQVAGKTWASQDIIAGFVRAVHALVEPQAHLCSWGQDKRLSTAELRTHLDASYGWLKHACIAEIVQVAS